MRLNFERAGLKGRIMANEIFWRDGQELDSLYLCSFEIREADDRPKVWPPFYQNGGQA